MQPGAAVRGIDPTTNHFMDPGLSARGHAGLCRRREESVWIGMRYPGIPGDSDGDVFKYRRYDPKKNVLFGPDVTVLEPIEGRVGFGSLWVPHPSGTFLLSTPES
jgi:hypothetical protein